MKSQYFSYTKKGEITCQGRLYPINGSYNTLYVDPLVRSIKIIYGST